MREEANSRLDTYRLCKKTGRCCGRNCGDHTNSLVPIYAKGDAARLLRGYADQWDPVRGRYLDNAELGKTLYQAIQ